MEKEFYIGQPLIVKATGEKVTFAYSNESRSYPCNVFKKDRHDYYDYADLEPSTLFNFSQIIAGLEQGYFDVGTGFRRSSTGITITVGEGDYGLYLVRPSELIFPTSKDINSTWTLVDHRKKMTLEEIEAELGYKIKLD